MIASVLRPKHWRLHRQTIIVTTEEYQLEQFLLNTNAKLKVRNFVDQEFLSETFSWQKLKDRIIEDKAQNYAP